MICGTHTVWVSSCGLSACSGNTGCGGSPMGTQPRDLLMAWLSFLAGDFCDKRGEKKKQIKSNFVVYWSYIAVTFLGKLVGFIGNILN